MSVFVIIELPNTDVIAELFCASIISPIPNAFITVLGFTLTISLSVFALYRLIFKSYPYFMLLLFFVISLSPSSKYFFNSFKLLLCFLLESVVIISFIMSAEYTFSSSLFSALSVFSSDIDCIRLDISTVDSSIVIGYEESVSSSTLFI